jgi:hypothetical protein
MNRKYYSRIYLNPNPNALDMSMLDNNDWLNNENEYVKQQLLDKDSTIRIDLMQNNSFDLFNTKIEKLNSIKNIWIKIETKIKLENSWGAYIYSELRTGDSIKTNKIRTVNPLTKQGQVNDYAFYIEVPKYFYKSNFKLYISTTSPFHGELKKLNIITLINK